MRIEKASTAMGRGTKNGESTPHSKTATVDATISVADLYDIVKTYDKKFTPAPLVNTVLLNDDRGTQR